MSKKRPANDSSWSGGNTTYKDKMVQMTQQERLIEEKRKKIMEKMQSQPPQPAIPQSSSTVKKPGLPSWMKKSKATKEIEKEKATPSPEFFSNDGSFMERFLAMQAAAAGKSSSSLEKSEKKAEKGSKPDTKTMTIKDLKKDSQTVQAISRPESKTYNQPRQIDDRASKDAGNKPGIIGQDNSSASQTSANSQKMLQPCPLRPPAPQNNVKGPAPQQQVPTSLQQAPHSPTHQQQQQQIGPPQFHAGQQQPPIRQPSKLHPGGPPTGQLLPGLQNPNFQQNPPQTPPNVTLPPHSVAYSKAPTLQENPSFLHPNPNTPAQQTRFGGPPLPGPNSGIFSQGQPPMPPGSQAPHFGPPNSFGAPPPPQSQRPPVPGTYGPPPNPPPPQGSGNFPPSSTSPPSQFSGYNQPPPHPNAGTFPQNQPPAQNYGGPPLPPQVAPFGQPHTQPPQMNSGPFGNMPNSQVPNRTPATPNSFGGPPPPPQMANFGGPTQCTHQGPPPGPPPPGSFPGQPQVLPPQSSATFGMPPSGPTPQMTHAGGMYGMPPQQPGSHLPSPVKPGEEREVYGKYGQIVMKKEQTAIKQENSSLDYDPSMPTEGDSPVKLASDDDIKLERDQKSLHVAMQMRASGSRVERKRPSVFDETDEEFTSVSPPEDPDTVVLVEQMASFFAQCSPDKEKQALEDYRDNSVFWFLYEETSHAHQYFKFKVAELKKQIGDGSEADSEDVDGKSASGFKLRRKKRSRWGPQDDQQSALPVGIAISQGLGTNVVKSRPPQVTLQDFARKMVGSDSLNEDQIKQIRHQQEMNMMYELILAKKKVEEAALMAEMTLMSSGPTKKNKYEYDSDEETEGGTWEHKQRMSEMEATKEWAEALTEANKGKHFIGDFLPPDELERFMETFRALKEGREPDLTDYKDFKLTCENLGYKMLQKLGWKEGEGLGAEGQGIKDPVNKGSVSVDGRGIGMERPAVLDKDDDEFDAYRKRMMLAYRFRPNPLNNPRRPYY
ncbi:SURP and G-patch domain-containing protein 1-like [Saccostrea echinata]|uniref:SURP and G-patch domain-containing protein 1-like n=1 Tax=Saccostrea echinata TaxID=191078 RepID=UPI002A826D03|nr:SURP and G-patch domain-containing protein 1-like [Saccostrea echinata]